MAHAIRYRRFGGPEVLEMSEVPDTPPGAGEVRVTVRTAGLNPVDAKTFAGGPLRVLEAVDRVRRPSTWFGRGPARFPRTVGRDFAGTIDAIGAGVTGFQVGEAVLGTLRSAPGHGDTRGTLTERLNVPTGDITPKPDSISFEVGAAIGVAAMTAGGALRALDATRGDVLVVSAAAGSVGSMTTQLAVHRGITVIGIAGERNSDYLRSLGAIPVVYGPDLQTRLRSAAPSPITAFLDCYGRGYLKTALALEVPPTRVGTLVPNPAAMVKGVQFTGSRHAHPEDLREVTQLVADGVVVIDINRVYPFDVSAVRDAYTRLAGGHVRGKLVVTLP